VICANAYFSLVKASLGKLLMVPAGSNCQMFLAPPTEGGRGFVFMGSDGQAYVENAPSLRLPIINPVTGPSFELPGGFPFIIIGTGVEPNPWRFLAAPTAGNFSLVSENRQFFLRGQGQTTGQTAVCPTDTAVAKVSLFGCFQTGLDGDDNPVYALRKLAVSHDRPVVGHIDEFGVGGFRCAAPDSTFNHPLAAFNELKAATWLQINAGDGNVEGDGFPNAILTGPDAITDGRLLMWSPTTRKFYTFPAATKETLTVNADNAVADNGTYVSMGGHCLFSNLNFNHPDFFIAATIRMANDATNYAGIDYGLFIDGVQVHTWDVKGSKDNTLTHIHQGLEIGIHTIEIKFRQPAGAGDTVIKYSDTQLHSVY